MTAEERFFEKVVKMEQGYETDCWEWIAYKNEKGYGIFRGENSKKKDGYKGRLAHRWSYEHFVGKIEEGLELDHMCRNRACVNPEHLRQVIHKTNAQFMVSNNSKKTHCPKGHLYAGNNLFIRTRKDGRPYRMCRACKQEKERMSYGAKNSSRQRS